MSALPDDVADKWAYRLLSTSDIEALDADPLITDGGRPAAGRAAR